jgi:hypothetical protein
LFVKTFIATLIPYPTPGLIEENDVPTDFLEKIISELDLAEVEKIDNIERLFEFVLNFYENRLVSREKFKKTLLAITITQKGLTLPELMTLVTSLARHQV